MIYFESKRFFYNHSGLGHYERWLICGMLKKYADMQVRLLKPGKKFSMYSNRISPDSVIEYSNFLGMQRSIFLENGLDKDSILHGLSNELPLWKSSNVKARIVTIHDVIFKIRPKDYSLIDRTIYDVKTKNAIERADLIIAISEQTKSDLINAYKAPEEKIKVIYQSCSSDFYVKKSPEQLAKIRTKYNLPDKFAVVLSAFTPRKNHKLLIDMMSLLPEEFRRPIVCIGEGSEKTAFLEKMNLYKLTSYFIVLNQVPDADVPEILQASSCMVYPSLYEGFGRPILEGFASRVPVICHHQGAIAEATGGAALLVDCADAENLSNAYIEVQQNENKVNILLQKAELRLKDFASDSLLEKYDSVYRNIL